MIREPSPREGNTRFGGFSDGVVVGGVHLSRVAVGACSAASGGAADISGLGFPTGVPSILYPFPENGWKPCVGSGFFFFRRLTGRLSPGFQYGEGDE